MGTLVNAGTTCICALGTVPLPLLTADQTVTGGGPQALNIMDIPKGVFGVCNSPTNPAAVAAKVVGASAPCTPAFLPPMWLPGSPTVLLRGAPALNNTCTMTCALGTPSCIVITAPGAATVQVP